jgi:competence protein ComEC
MKRRSFDESDLIRLKLQRLEAQTDSRSLLDSLFSTAPILPFTIALIAGILIASGIKTIHTFWLISLCLMPLVLLLTAAACRVRSTLRFMLILFNSCLLILMLGMVHYYSLIDIPPEHISHYFSSDRELATLKGSVISPIRRTQSKNTISSIPWLGSQSSFYLETKAVKTTNGWQQTSGKVRVQIAEPVDHVTPGNTVQIDCWLSRFSRPPNPGQYDLHRHMALRGVYIAASIPVKEGIVVVDSNSSLISKMRAILYRRTAAALLDETVTDMNVRSLVSALLLGRRGNLNPQVMAAFQDTNLAHFISLSGMHVGIIAGSLWMMLRTIGLSRRRRAILCIVLIVLYALVVPPRAATLRAVFLSCFFFTSVLVSRQASPLNTLALSAFVLLLFRPWELFSAGWQLSFMSVLGILLFYPAVRFQLLTQLFYPAALKLNRFVLLNSVLHAVIELLAVGISVWITIAPILLYYFGQVNPFSPVWTVLVMPFVVVILYAGFIKLFLTAVFPTLAAVFGWILNFACTGFENTVLFLSKIDFLRIVSPRPALCLVGAIYVLMLIFYLLPYRYIRLQKVLFVLIALCFLFPAVSRYIDNQNRDTLEMTWLSVGHGQAVVLSGPDNQNMLFDAGSITNQNITHKIILPFLQLQNIYTLNSLYLSHGDMDHVNAVVDLNAGFKVNTFYANQVLLENATKPSYEKEVFTRLARMGKHPRSVHAPYQQAGLTITSLWPPEDINANKNMSENDTSEVILIEYANRKILLCGDIERYTQNQIIEQFPDLKVDVLSLPHHGSVNNLNPRFFEHLKPSVVIASCSQRTVENAYRPPSDSFTQAYYTAADGAVTVKIKADGTFSTAGYLSQ